MTIRRARAVDIPRILELMTEMHLRSVYAKQAGLAKQTAWKLLEECVLQDGKSGPGATHCQVAENRGVVEGFIIGMLDPVYHVLDRLTATDLYFYCSPRADKRDAMRLLRSFHEWAMSKPKVIEISMGATDAIGRWQDAETFYKRVGLTQTGIIYGRRIAR